MSNDSIELRFASVDQKLDTLTERVSEIREILAEERGKRKGVMAFASALGAVAGFAASLLRR